MGAHQMGPDGEAGGMGPSSEVMARRPWRGLDKRGWGETSGEGCFGRLEKMADNRLKVA